MSKSWHFHGCSLSTDEYVIDKADAYPNLVGEHFSKDVVIKAKGGNSNQSIFADTIVSLLDDTCDTVFVQITEPGRQNFYLDCDNKVSTLGENRIFPKSKWNSFLNTFRIIDQEYNQYVLLNRNIPILNKLATATGKKLYFINGYLYVNSIFFNYDTDINYYLLDDECKRIINFDEHQDDMLGKQINDIRQKLSVINPTQWIMLEKTLSSLRVDSGTDNMHPGVESNLLYAKLVIEYIEKQK